MNMIADRLVVPLLFALMHVSLISRFVVPAQKWTLRKRVIIMLFGMVAHGIARRLESLDGMASYLYLAASITAVYGFIWVWSGLQWKAALQRALCYVLLTECLTLSLCHVSQETLGLDIFRSEPLWRMILAMAVMWLVNALSLSALAHCFPPEVLVDGNSLILSLLSSIPFLYAWRITVWLPVAHEDVPLAAIITMMSSCFLSLILIVSLESRLYEEREKQKAQAMQRVMELRQQQYIIRKNSIEQVRRQYHDMKNLLLYLEKAPTRENMRAHMAKIIDEMHPFETVLDTGNEVMDILLGEKLNQCEKNHIVCTVIADGGMLSFIAPLDLVTILGNAMDNAIEACMRVPEGQRFIQVRTMQQDGFSILSFSNSCDGRTFLCGKLLLTRKRDPENHGFGLANIRRTVEKYEGEMNWHADEEEFTLTLLFQRPREAMQ